jgi:MFS family permease
MATSPPAASPAPRRLGSRLTLEIALAVSVAVAFADSSIVVLALPELYVDFDTSIPGISWVVTAYNVAVVIASLALLPLVRRVRPAWLALAGLLVFLASCIVCAVADDLGTLIGGRVAQGVGAALLLGASLPLFVAIGDRRERAIGIWIAAGTLGTAVGPALGGVLTEAFDWRAIFAVQAPLAAAAIVVALDSRARALPPPSPIAERIALGSSLGLVFTFAALVGALFLAVLLVVTVWGYGPLSGAAIVSALPLAALAVRPLSRRLPSPADFAGGSVLLAAGLLALALLPASDPAYAIPALALAGAGLGLALPPLTRASVPDHGEVMRSAVVSVGVRHLGLVVGLLAVAPLLAAELDEAADRATINATAVILDAPLPIQTKIPVALDLYDEFQAVPEGEIPDLARPFDEHGADDDEAVRETRDTLLDEVQAVLTRAFRSSFTLSAVFALLAGASAVAFARRVEA